VKKDGQLDKKSVGQMIGLGEVILKKITKTNQRPYMKSSDAKTSKCHLKISSIMIIFIKLVYLSSVFSLKWQ